MTLMLAGLALAGTLSSAGVPWEPWSDQAFTRARAEKRLVLLDVGAEWCHWCHVMDETTYRDPEIGRVLRERFIAVRVDIDARPDLAERYGEWGWPATIVLSPDAEELGKFRGYIPPEKLLPILRDVERLRLGPGVLDGRWQRDVVLRRPTGVHRRPRVDHGRRRRRWGRLTFLPRDGRGDHANEHERDGDELPVSTRRDPRGLRRGGCFGGHRRSGSPEEGTAQGNPCRCDRRVYEKFSP